MCAPVLPDRPSSRQTPRMRKVILVDDDPIQLRIREAVLRGAGLEVVIATTAESALAILRVESASGTLGALVTDHIMPRVSGAEFVRLVRQVNPTVPVIVISGMAEAQDEYEGLNVAFKQKPCPPVDLISLVRRSVDDAA